ncbi:hypothetical protein K3495_g9335 [Podosphaera aphanis]|nr:hypothetical protein K3495_g9335 [Podosphaera aphanis]
MALQVNRKYASLPDLDSAPDIYETPELTDDNSIAIGRVRSDSNVSSCKEPDDVETGASAIFRSRLHLNEARSYFSPSIIDAQGVDFSDRITAKRKSYKSSSRRQQQRHDKEFQQFADLSDQEIEESLERKVARLKREIEEVKEEYEKAKAGRDNSSEEVKDLEPDVDSLSKALDQISTSQEAASFNTGGKFVKDLATGIKANGPPQTSQGAGEPATYTVTYAPTYHQSHALARAADFDGRLTMLEKILGIGPTEMPKLDTGTPKAILSTLDKLQCQISVISQARSSSLDSMSRQISAMTLEAEKLRDARKAAKAAQDASRNAGGDNSLANREDSEQSAKINALYGTLPTIEKLGPLLPPLLDRLRSLRAIHSEAATTKNSLDQIDKQQIEMAEDIKRWREGQAKLEEAMVEAEKTMKSNIKVVEEWVKSLEETTKSLIT